MFENDDLYKEFSECFDYTARLVYIKKNKKRLTPQFIETITLHAKIMLDEGEIPLAIELADLALIASTCMEDERHIASSLLLKSQLTQLQNSYDESENLLLKAKDIYDREKMDDKLCTIYNLIAYLYKLQKKYEEAIEYYKKAVDISQKINKKELYALNLSAIAEIEYSRTRPQQALWYFKQALDAYRITGETKSQAQILNWIGYININIKLHEEALKSFLEVEDILSNESDKVNSSLAYAKFHLGTIYQHLDKPSVSLRYLIEAVYIWKKREMLQVLSELNFYWGKIYKGIGLSDKSLTFFRQSLKLLQYLNSKKGMLSIIFQIKNLEEAEDSYESPQNYFARHLNTRTKREELNNDFYLFEILSDKYRDLLYKEDKCLYFNIGSPSFTNKFNIKALNEDYRKTFTVSNTHLSIAFQQIASIYNNMNMPSCGLPYLIELLEIKKKVYQPVILKQMLDGLKEISLYPEQEDAYNYYLQEITRLMKKFVSNSDKSLITYEIGLAYFSKDNYRTAEEMFKKSLNICSIFKNKEMESIIYRSLVWYEIQENNLEKAINYIQKAIKIDETIKSGEELLDLLILRLIYMIKKETIRAVDYHIKARNRANDIIYSGNNILLLKNKLLISNTYFQVKILCQKKIDLSLINKGTVFNEIKNIDFIQDKNEDSFWDYLSNIYVSIPSLHKKNIHEATHYIIKSLKLILSLQLEKKDTISLFRLGLLYHTIGMSHESKYLLKSADEYFKELTEEKSTISPFAYRATGLFILSVLLTSRGYFSEAMQLLLEGEDIEKIGKNKSNLARIYYHKGIIREYEKNTEKAMEEYDRAMEIFLLLNSHNDIVKCLNKLAILDRESGKNHLTGAIAILDKEKNPVMYGQLLFNQAMMQNIASAKEKSSMFKKALEYFKIMEAHPYIIITLKELVRVSMKNNDDIIVTDCLKDAWLLIKSLIPSFVYEKIEKYILTSEPEKELELIECMEKILFSGPLPPLTLPYLYWINVELFNFFSIINRDEKEYYANKAINLRNNIIDIWGYNIPVFLHQNTENVYNIITEPFNTGKNIKINPPTDKNISILNLKENDSLIKKCTSITEDIEKNKDE